MSTKIKLFSYGTENTVIHRLSGLTKLLCFLFLTFAVMYSYDIRVIIMVMIFSITILVISKIKFSQIKVMVLYVLIFILTNMVLSFFFAPEMGVEIYGTRHVIAPLFGRFALTEEQLLYQVTKQFKYASVIPLGMIFLLTTNPQRICFVPEPGARELQSGLCGVPDPALFSGYSARLP